MPRNTEHQTRIITTHRLICNKCHNTVCYYSYTHSERSVMNEIDNVLCPKCEEKQRLERQ